MAPPLRPAVSLLLLLSVAACGEVPPGHPPAAPATPPVLSGWTVEPPVARRDSTVLLRFDSSEPLARAAAGSRNPSVSLAGAAMGCAVTGSSAACSLELGEAMREGEATFLVEAVSAAGATTGQLVPPVSVLLDFTPPVLLVRAERQRAPIGRPVRLLVAASEPLASPPSFDAPFLLGTPACVESDGGRAFDCTGLAVAEAATPGSLGLTASGRDLAGNSGTSPELLLELVPAPVVRIDRIEPALAGLGASISIELSADRALTACAAAVAGVPAPCGEPVGSTCSCSLTVLGDLPDGVAIVLAAGGTADGHGDAEGSVRLDVTRPVVDGALIELVRYPVGTEEAVRAAPLALTDGGDAYPERGVLELRLWAEASGGAPILVAGPGADGSLPERALAGTSLTAPQRLWASAVDRCGNEGERVELSGSDVDPPLIDRARLSLHRHPAGSDTVGGATGAVRDPPADQLASVRLYEDAAGTSPRGPELRPAPDGSFAEQAVGAGAPERLWLRAIDKAGNVSTSTVGTLVLTRSLAGRHPYDDPASPAALLPWIDDGDPRLHPPPEGELDSGVAGSVAFGAASEPDARRARLSVGPDPREEPDWLQTGPTPDGRRYPAAVFDSGRGRVVAFGGWGGNQPLASTLEYDGTAWFRMNVPDPPAARGTAMAFDASRGVTVLFGGTSPAPGVLGDTWEYDGATWTEVSPVLSPPARQWHALTYDSIRQKVVLFGGRDPAADLADTWEYDGRTWTETTPAVSPSPRSNHALAFDSLRGRVVLFGGQDFPTKLGDSWEYDGTAWTQLQPPLSPSPRQDHAMAFDAVRGRTVLVGGAGPIGSPLDTWEYDGLAWTTASFQDAPSSTDSAALVFDSTRGRVVLIDNVLHGETAGTWEYDGSWSLAVPGAAAPQQLDSPIAHDSARGETVSFERTYAGAATWEYETDAWVRAPLANGPTSWSYHSMVYDSARRRMVLFGGSPDSGLPIEQPLLQETWEHDGIQWGQVNTLARPPGRIRASMTYDEARGRVVLFGGEGPPGRVSPGEKFGDTWEYDGVNWRAVVTPIAPAARSKAMLAYDSVRGRSVLFGGAIDAGPGSAALHAGDTWEYDGSGWTEVVPAVSPSPRFAAAMAFDSRVGELVLFGGTNSPAWNEPPRSILRETWSYDGGSWTLREPGSHPFVSEGPSATFDAGRGVVVLRGRGRGTASWEYVRRTPHARAAAHAMVFSLEHPGPPSSLRATYVGAGLGAEPGGTPAAGVELLAWNAGARQWRAVGSQLATDEDPELLRTIAAELPGLSSEYLADGRIWLLATPLWPSSTPPGTTRCELWTDFVELEASFALP